MTQKQDPHEQTLRERSAIPPADPAQTKPPPNQRGPQPDRGESLPWWAIAVILVIVVVLLVLFAEAFVM